MTEREQYVEDLNNKLKQWNTRIDELKAKADAAEEKKKRKILKQVEVLQKKRQNLENEIQKLKNAGEAAWSDMKGGAQKAVSDLEKGIQKAFSRLKS